MQTFLPYPDFAKSAACLDNRRLGKQRVECLQILRALQTGPVRCKACKIAPISCKCLAGIAEATPWYNHPTVQMWKGYELALAQYGYRVCVEWINRGFRDTCCDKFTSYFKELLRTVIHPPWLGIDAFHSSHRSNLLRKDPVWYGQFGWTESSNLPYYWPTKQ